MALIAIGLGGCDKDDELLELLGGDVYKGYIQEVNPGAFLIRVTYSPYNRRDPDLSMPIKNELMYGYTTDSPDLELKVNQKLLFRIISAKGLIIPCFYDPTTYPSWRCEIKIIKIY